MPQALRFEPSDREISTIVTDLLTPWYEPLPFCYDVDQEPFDNSCLDCNGRGYQYFFDDDYFDPIYMYWVWGTLEEKSEPCRICKQTGSLFVALHLQNERESTPPYLGTLLRKVLKEEEPSLSDEGLSNLFRLIG